MSVSASIFIVDDHPAVREGLALLLAKDQHTICGEASSRTELMEQLDFLCPNLALIDLSLGEENGLTCISDLLSKNSHVIIYSMHEDAGIVKRALDHGAQGFVSKRESSAILLEAIQTVLGGDLFLSPRVAANLEAGDAPIQPPQLSGRERQVLTLLAKGETNADIASKFDVSIRTVETYFNRIQTKLDLNGMKDLRKYAHREFRPI
ncbi:MAG: response regulator transcription factor [Pseudodesulfovibrio sp.]|nr:response regulator transcription factor [Pseudodesulfovibrio sp.]